MPAGLVQGWSPLHRTSAIALAATGVVLSAILFLELNLPVAPMEAMAPAQAEPREATASDGIPHYAFPPLQQFAAVTERPLFSEDRQPAPDGDAGSIGPLSSLQLAGVIITSESREAMIAHDQPPVFVHIREGQEIDGWVVRSIEPDRVVLRNGAESHELRLIRKSGDAAEDDQTGHRSLNWRDD